MPQVAPRSHRRERRDDGRRPARRTNPHGYAKTRMNRPLLTSMVRRGSAVRVRQRAWKKPCKWASSVACDGEIRSPCGYETGTFWDWGALAGIRGVSRHTRGVLDGYDRDPPTKKVPAKTRSVLPVVARRRAPPLQERVSTVVPCELWGRRRAGTVARRSKAAACSRSQ